jgi:hypothetical protein
MDIKRKTCDSRIWKKHLLLDISSTNTDTLVPSLYQCFETRSTEFFYSCISYFLTWSGIICDFLTSLREFLDLVVNRFTRQTLPTVNRKHVFMNILCIGPFVHKKSAKQNAALRYYTSQARSPFWLLKPACEHARARLLRRLSWSWAVLLPSGTHIKPITSITTVWLPFVTYLLTLS